MGVSSSITALLEKIDSNPDIPEGTKDLLRHVSTPEGAAETFDAPVDQAAMFEALGSAPAMDEIKTAEIYTGDTYLVWKVNGGVDENGVVDVDYVLRTPDMLREEWDAQMADRLEAIAGGDMSGIEGLKQMGAMGQMIVQAKEAMAREEADYTPQNMGSEDLHYMVSAGIVRMESSRPDRAERRAEVSESFVGREREKVVYPVEEGAEDIYEAARKAAFEAIDQAAEAIREQYPEGEVPESVERDIEKMYEKIKEAYPERDEQPEVEQPVAPPPSSAPGP